jgi:hypothetical protein
LVLAIRRRIEKTVGMRGTPDPQLAMLTTLSTEELIPADHPIRRIRVVVDAVLAERTLYDSRVDADEAVRDLITRLERGDLDDRLPER